VKKFKDHHSTTRIVIVLCSLILGFFIAVPLLNNILSLLNVPSEDYRIPGTNVFLNSVGALVPVSASFIITLYFLYHQKYPKRRIFI